MATIPVPVTRTPRKKAANGTTKTQHTATVQFTSPEDIQLYEVLEQQAKDDRRPLPLFILLRLHDLYAGKLNSEAAE